MQSATEIETLMQKLDVYEPAGLLRCAMPRLDPAAMSGSDQPLSAQKKLRPDRSRRLLEGMGSDSSFLFAVPVDFGEPSVTAGFWPVMRKAPPTRRCTRTVSQRKFTAPLNRSTDLPAEFKSAPFSCCGSFQSLPPLCV
jgi:hypothetical protein